MFRNAIIFVSMILISVMLAGCGGGEEGEMTEQKAEFVATVDGEKITEDEVSKEIANIKRQMAGRVGPEQLDQMGQMLRQQAVSNLVNRVLLTNAAEENDIKVTDAEIESRIEQVKGQFQSEEAFRGQLEQSGLSMEDFREEVRKSIKLENLMDMKTAHVTSPTGEESKDFYDSNTEQFSNPARIRASHILLGVEEGAPEAVHEQKKEQLGEIRKQILEGAEFAELAEEYSDCPSSSRGGDLGFFASGQMVKPFEEAAFALDVGEVSDIVKTRFGYHLIKVTEKEEAGKVPFDEAQANIEEYLLSMRRQEEMNDYLSSLRESAEIEYADSALATGAGGTP